MSYSWLPSLLAEIAEVAGLDAALALARARGGSRITIPAAPGKGHWLCKLVGREAALALAEHFATSDGVSRRRGAILELPVGPVGAHAQVSRRVDAMIRAGVSADEIARTVGVSRRTVFRRKGRSDLDCPSQLRLFD